MLDIIIKDGLIVDGTGREPFLGTISVKDGKIASVNNLSPKVEGLQVIEAKNRIVTPGFIDMHSHSELDLLINPMAESTVCQGITTVLSFIACGRSTGPLIGEAFTGIQEHIRNRFGETSAIGVSWRTSKEFYDLLEKNGTAVNYANLVGATTIRECVIGFERRSPTGSELKKMESLAQQAMEEGAWGISTGLEYAPGAFANKAEIVALCRVVARLGGIYSNGII